MTARLADFYIIGAMKCATSTLHEQLARRSRFFMSEPKEPNFFNDLALYPAGMADYEKLFAAAKSDQITGESSTHYTKLPTYQGTAERIFQHTPQARLVYVMRDPVDRLVSQYIHQWTERAVDVPLSEAVRQLPEYISYSCYARQLAPFLELFDKQQVMLVFFEHLVKNRATELERVARFLGDSSSEPYEWKTEAAQTNVSKDRMRKSPWREAVLSFPGAKMIKDALPGDVRERIKSFWRMEKRPSLDAAAERYVKDAINRDLAVLGELTGLHINCDNFKEVASQAQPTLV